MRPTTPALFLVGVAAVSLDAQTLAQRVLRNEGTVQVVYPSRPDVCGDGRGMISHLFGRSAYYSGDVTVTGHGNWSDRPCERGPARALVSVMSGEITRIRAYVGPVPTDRNVTTIEASAADAAAWLTEIVSRSDSRVGAEAVFPLVLANVPDPWPFLLRVARDSDRSRALRHTALDWLAQGVSAHLGVADAGNDTADDEMRAQAVFALSQRPKAESVPDLIELARSAKHASARRAAIFWLGQTGDPRAVEVYAELLGLR